MRSDKFNHFGVPVSAKHEDETYYEDIKVDREDENDRQIILEDVIMDPQTSPCGQEVRIRAKAYNIGEDDQESVLVNAYNKELGIDLYKVLDNFDMEDSARNIEFSLLMKSVF